VSFLVLDYLVFIAKQMQCESFLGVLFFIF
jgi:hypothetical protein